MNNSSLTVFNFQSNDVRTILVNGEPAFCLSDVLFAYKTSVEDAEKSITDYLGEEFIFRVKDSEFSLKAEEKTFIFEAAVTFLLSRSKTPLGKLMNKWLHNEILPQLRKTGQYSIEKTNQKSEKLFAKEFIESMWNDISNRYPEIDKRLIDGAKLNGYTRHYPELAGEIAEAKKLISATSEVKSLPLSPTELGQIFAKEHNLEKVSAQKINAALILEGYQIKSDNKLSPYELTESGCAHSEETSECAPSKGQEYGEMQLETCQNHNKTIYRIRWQTDILKLIESTLISLIKIKEGFFKSKLVGVGTRPTPTAKFRIIYWFAIVI